MDSLVTFLEIVFINVLLSGDNAVVIALASQQLPEEQRRKAIWWGAALAVGLRCLLTLIALTLLQVPYLQAAGALLLFIIAIKLIADAAGGGQQSHHVRKARTLGQAVRTIIAADFVMSLDNVLAIAAVAEGEPVLILLGIAISIPMIIWGSQLLSRLLQKFPPLVYIGGGLLGYAAGEMLVHDPGIIKLLMNHYATFKEAVPILSVPFVIAIALLRLRR
ncbi:TerC family protein [Paenibacillus mendelii]|uniref:TerC family protein n=1 Tax=Paenibacillus mendelii TaxID=206163 RepID=A0ABV6JHL8_9BACL|nr:TerC family protein [Paenibacillus mendelii]MCQ6558296.1 TerC family protein [Paenibacillus mendelii]